MNRTLSNLSVKTSLAIVLALFSALIVLVAGLGYQSGRLGTAALHEMDRIGINDLYSVNRGQLSVADTQLFLLNSLDARNEGQDALADNYLNIAIRNMEAAQRHFAHYQSTPKTEDGKDDVIRILSSFSELLQQGLIPQQEALQRQDESAFRAAKRTGDQLNQAFIAAVEEYIEHAEAYSATLMVEYERESTLFGYIELASLVLAGIIVVVVWAGMTRIVIRPLEEAVIHFERIAQGDLSQKIADRGRNEIGQLFSAMGHMQTGLSRTVSGVRDSSGSIHVGAREIAQGNNDLSSRTEEQAAALQQTAASMEQLTATVKQNADNARQGSTLARDASLTAGRGGEVVDQVIVTMHGIADSSRKVTDIISVIDSIAFQTNILALNASVEAARAGEQGRGFAVVASEVRNLASRSAEAAKEIKQLIDASANQVHQGSELVESAGSTMRDVVASVRRVTDIMDEISAASQEQSEGIEQVTQAVSQMDQVTQQNASLVEQASASAASLEEQAALLETAVATFRLSNEKPARATAVVRAQLPSHASHAPAAASAKAVSKSKTARSAEPEWEEF
ncbi:MULTISPECIES: methyl-accepting chemotaxis protein [Halomonadaceae]|uniref:methyl-accepting chemotaxis protein n=1 Tax=Halomonadaceae TaxID=28256 RepID=UPI0015978766|nr:MULTISPECIES: methyl-accepting chemotaxis protein [Halomonas]QJQ94229.1 HAMP domain-containing protein [Halomonas sp. PA5]